MTTLRPGRRLGCSRNELRSEKQKHQAAPIQAPRGLRGVESDLTAQLVHGRYRDSSLPCRGQTIIGGERVNLIGIKPIIKYVSHRSCEHVETRPSLSGIGEKFFLDFSSLDKSPELAYENTSFDYEFVNQPHDG